MDKDTLINNLLANYGKYGVTRAELEPIIDDVMAITGESREELLQRIEQCRQELIEVGENPDEYFKPVEPQRAAVYYFPNGLH